MAESVGSKIRKILVGILIGFLVIGFAIWGVSDVFTPGASNSAASVGNEQITLREFDVAMRRALREQAEESGRALTNQEAYAAGLHTRVLGELITQKAIDVDALDLGIGVNRRTARKFVSQISAFTDEVTGEFSEQQLDTALVRNDLTRDQFERDILETLRRQQTIPAVVSGLDLPTSMAENFYSFVTEQRKASVLTLTEASITAPKDPSDDVLKTYINVNQARFTAPEYRKISYIRIEPVDLSADITVSEEDIEAGFQYRIDRGQLGTQETRSIIQITATSEDSAKKILTQMELGLDPKEIATGLGLDAPVSYDSVLQDAIVDPVAAETAFGLALDETVVVKNDFDVWMVLKALFITPATTPVLADMREEIERELLTELAQEELFDITSNIENSIDDGLTLEEISGQYEIPYSSANFINRQGALQDGTRLDGNTRIPGLASDDEILRQIFTADIGLLSNLFETSTNGWMAVRVDNTIPPTLRPFDTIRDNALALWKTEQIDDLLQEKMLEVSSRAQTGDKLSDIVAEIGAGASLSDVSVVRGQPGQTIGSRVTLGLLDGSVGTIARGPGAQPLTRQVALLTEIIANNDGLAGQFAEVVEQQILNTVSSDIQNAYRQAIFNDNPVAEYQTQIARSLNVDLPN